MTDARGAFLSRVREAAAAGNQAGRVPALPSGARVGIRAACLPGVVKITAGNYGGKLGPFHIRLHQVLSQAFIADKS